MKVAELREELNKRGLETKELKPRSVVALTKAMDDCLPIKKERTEEHVQPTVFDTSVKWQKMSPLHAVEDPTSSSYYLRAPTVPENEQTTQYKYGF